MEGERVVAVLIVIGRLELGFMAALSLLLLLLLLVDFVNVFLCFPATDVVFPFSVFVLLLLFLVVVVVVVVGLPFWLLVILLFFAWVSKLTYLFQ